MAAAKAAEARQRKADRDRVSERHSEVEHAHKTQLDAFRPLGGEEELAGWLRTALKREGMGEGRLAPRLDSDGSGVITLQRFENGLRDANIGLDVESFRTLWRILDKACLRVLSIDEVRGATPLAGPRAAGTCVTRALLARRCLTGSTPDARHGLSKRSSAAGSGSSSSVPSWLEIARVSWKSSAR